MSSKKNHYKEKMMRRKEEKKEELEAPKYCDHAKERHEDQNPDYEPTELGSFHAVAPPVTDLLLADAHKISIEKSKYLGGDLEHTLLVKGLDYARLHKVRSEFERKPDAEDGKDAKPRRTDLPMIYRQLFTGAKLIALFQRKWLLSVWMVLYLTELPKSCHTFDLGHREGLEEKGDTKGKNILASGDYDEPVRPSQSLKLMILL